MARTTIFTLNARGNVALEITLLESDRWMDDPFKVMAANPVCDLQNHSGATPRED